MTEHKIMDAIDGSWVDRAAPAFARPWLRLIRADRPIGTWLLFWPGAWSIAMAARDVKTAAIALLLFLIGAFVMRGAGCVFNDYVDRDIDAKVERTKNRPLASGQISPREGLLYMVALALCGFVILLQFNALTIFLGVASLGLIAVYPFMKRVTDWPQAFLGLTFNWGAIIGWTAVTGALDVAALYLYAGAFFWTLGYDTIYAHQDKEDDALIGVRSTARLLGARTRLWVGIFYAAFVGLALMAGLKAGAGALYFVGVAAVAIHLALQVRGLEIDTPTRCLATFRMNALTGALLFAGAVGSHL